MEKEMEEMGFCRKKIKKNVTYTLREDLRVYDINFGKLGSFCEKVNEEEITEKIREYERFCSIEMDVEFTKDTHHLVIKSEKETRLSIEFLVFQGENKVLNEGKKIEEIIGAFEKLGIDFSNEIFKMKCLFDKEKAEKELLDLYEEAMYRQFVLRKELEHHLERLLKNQLLNKKGN